MVGVREYDRNVHLRISWEQCLGQNKWISFSVTYITEGWRFPSIINVQPVSNLCCRLRTHKPEFYSSFVCTQCESQGLLCVSVNTVCRRLRPRVNASHSTQKEALTLTAGCTVCLAVGTFCHLWGLFSDVRKMACKGLLWGLKDYSGNWSSYSFIGNTRSCQELWHIKY